MAYEKLTDRSELTTAADTDLVHVVDVSDNATDAAGNSKKMTVANLMKSAPVQSSDLASFATESYVDTAVDNEETARIAGDDALQLQISDNDADITALDGRITTAEGEIDALQAQTYVESLNSLTGPVTLAGGTDITLTTAGSQITINSTASGGGGGGNTFTDIDGVTADSGSSSVDFVASTGMTITPNNTTKEITFAVSGLDTDDVTEGATNLYYTADRVLTQLTATSVTSLNDVSNAGSGAIITAAERTKLNGIEAGAEVNPATTDALTEGSSNLYYTEARVSANTDVAANTLKNSYPSADAAKLAGIEAGAEVNVQSDWDATSGDALILNKPTIPADLTDLGDTPTTLGSAGQVLAVATGGGTTEWVDQSGGSALTDTDDLPEGASNLYYTNTRVQTYLTLRKIRANYPSDFYTGNTLITSQQEQTLMIGKSSASMQFAVSAGLSKDCEILVMQEDVGSIIITGAQGVTILTSSSFHPETAGRYAIIGLKQIAATNVYVVTGERKPV